MFDRRNVLKGGAATVAVAAGRIGPAIAQDKIVKIGMIAPLSGPWARQGELKKMGGDLAVKHVNAQGGVKALGGAMLQLLPFDAGDSAEKAKNAAQRMLAQGLAALAAHMEPREAAFWTAQTATALTEAMTKTKEDDDLSPLVEGWAALAFVSA